MNGEGEDVPGTSSSFTNQLQTNELLAVLQAQLSRHTSAADLSRLFLPTFPSTLSSPLSLGLSQMPSSPSVPSSSLSSLQIPLSLPNTLSSVPLLPNFPLLNPATELQKQLLLAQMVSLRPSVSSDVSSSLRHSIIPPPSPLSSLPSTSSLHSISSSIPPRPVPRRPMPSSSYSCTASTSHQCLPSTSRLPSTSSSSSSFDIFAVPTNPAPRKSDHQRLRPSTLQDAIQKLSKETDSFEMGKLPTTNYFPSHFMKGTMIQLARGGLKKVEDLNSDDFLVSAPQSEFFHLEACMILNVTKTQSMSRIRLQVGQTKAECHIDMQLEQPLFVIGKGWTSVDPRRTINTYGLDCQQLKMGDVCVTLSQKDQIQVKAMDTIVTLEEAEKRADHERQQTAIRDQISKDMEEQNEDDRKSAPPIRYHPYSKGSRKFSEA